MDQQTAGHQNSRQLAAAFKAFNELSLQLADSYRELENRVAQLNRELAAARSERLRQLAEKERLANRLSRLLEALPGGVVVLDKEGIVRECNPAARDFLGEPLVGEPWCAVTRRAFVPGGGQGGEVTLRDGRQVNISTRSLDPEPGEIVLLKDVTETRALQDLVNRHKRLSAMGEMAACLAHQIRTPLAAALLYASHLARPDLAQADRARFAEKVLTRLRHLERMIGDMLMFARGGCFGVEDIPVEALVDDLRQSLEPQLAACAGTFRVEDAAPGAVLRGNREALSGAFLNLATNAVQACGEGARLVLETRFRDAGTLHLSLSDNGPGIPEHVRERIFEPFFTTRSNGTGLGLAVVRAVVEAHRGRVWVESREGTGSTFHVELPLAGAQDGLPGEAAPSRTGDHESGERVYEPHRCTGRRG